MAGPTIAYVEIHGDVNFSTMPAATQRAARTAGRIISNEMGRAGNEGGVNLSKNLENSVKTGLKQRLMKALDREIIDAVDGSGRKAGDSFGGGFEGGMLSRMDRTVALVITLIATIGPQMAALGSALSANLVAILGSALVALAGAFAALVPVLAGVAVGAVLLLKNWKDMVSSSAALQAAVNRVTSSWKAQGQALTRTLTPAMTSFMNTLGDVIARSNFGEAIGRSFAAITTAFNNVLRSPAMSGFVTAMQTTIPTAIAYIGTAAASLTQGLLQIFTAASPLAVKLGQDIANLAEKFKVAVQAASDSGALSRFFDRAYESIRAVMGVLGPLTLALGNVFYAGSESGNRLLGTLGELAQKFLDWTRSIEGQQSLQTWFTQAEGIFSKLIGVIGSLGRTLADMVTPETLTNVGSFLDDLTEILPLLGNVMSAIGDVNILGLFGSSLKGILEAIQPLLPALSSFAEIIGKIDPDVIGAIAAGVTAWAAAQKILNTALGGAAIKAIGWFFLELATGSTIVEALTGAVSAFGVALNISLGPIWWIVIAVAAVVAALVLFFTKTELGQKIVTNVWNAIKTAISAVVDWVTGTAVPWLSNAWDTIVAGVKAVGDWFGRVWQGILDAPGAVLDWFTGTLIPFFQSLPGLLLAGLETFVVWWISLPGRIIGALANLLAWIIQFGVDVTTSMINWVAAMIPKVVQFFLDLPGNIITALGNMASALGSFFTGVWNTIVSGVSSFIASAIAFFVALPGQIISAITALPGLLGGFFSSVWTTVYSAVKTGISSVVSFFSGLPGQVVSVLSALGSRLWQIFVDAMGQGNSAAVSGIANLLRTIGGIPGQVISALGNLGSALFGAGQSLIQGLINGIQNMIGKVTSAVSGVLSKARDLLPFSPAKEGPFSGKGWTLYSGQAMVDDLAQGIISHGGNIASAMSTVLTRAQPGTGFTFPGVGTGQALVSAANAGISRVMTVAPGAIVVNAPTDDPVQTANAVLDRLVARWK